MKTPKHSLKVERFKFGKFWVEIPTSIIRSCKRLDPGEEADIVDSILMVWTNLHGKALDAKLEPMLLNATIRQQLAPPSTPEYELWFQQSVKAALDPECKEMPQLPSAISYHQVKEKALELLKFAQFRNLSAAPINELLKRATKLAIDGNDHQFLTQLGRALERMPRRAAPYTELSPLQSLIVEHWITQDKKGPQFCCFTGRALYNFLHSTAKETSPTASNVSKTIERLGLQSTRKKLVSEVTVAGDVITLS